MLEQQQLHAMTARFPTPQLQMDDGDQDVADLHAREDLLLDHYTWVESAAGHGAHPHRAGDADHRAARTAGRSGGQRREPLMTADVHPEVTAPLTNGFARTGYEQRLEVEQSQAAGAAQGRAKPGEQARLAPPHP